MDTTISADGTEVRFYDQGRGSAILMVGPSLDDGTRNKKLAAVLTERFRVLRLHRRQYRLDLKIGGAPCSVAQEVDDVLAVTKKVGEPLVIYGHSSGGVVALEALAASPSSFTGAVIFEPPVVIGSPLAGAGGEVIKQARTAIAAGKPGKAMTIFLCRSVGLPPWQARLAGVFVALIPRYRKLAPCQIDDLEALDRLGARLVTYTQIQVPTLLLGGDRSPAHLTERLDALEHVMPNTQRIVLHNRDHDADLKAPKEVARAIQACAETVSRQSFHGDDVTSSHFYWGNFTSSPPSSPSSPSSRWFRRRRRSL